IRARAQAAAHGPGYRPRRARTCGCDWPSAGIRSGRARLGAHTIRKQTRALIPGHACSQYLACARQARRRDAGMRLKSAVWVAAYIRRCHTEGAFAAVRRRGAEEAGAIFVKLNRLDGTAELFGPAPQSAFADAHPAGRLFSRCHGEQPAPETKIEERLARELGFDPDAWILEVEDRAGRHFLDRVVA